MSRPTLRLILVAAICASIIVGTFAWLHSGAPGDATCERARFVSSSGFSAWPPGARCTYGEPPRTDVVVNHWFAVIVGLAVVLLAVARSSAGGRARPTPPAASRGGQSP